jgi:murein L,D-transpeptidase YcbB/YkuD
VQTPGSYLRALHPRHQQFELLRQALLKVRGGGAAEREAEAVVKLPTSGPVLKIGVDHPDVALLRKRLKVGAIGSESLFDEPMLEAVKAYQRKSGMRDDGVIGAGTRAALNAADRAPVFGSDEQRLVVNMERWRWMPEDMGEFHVWDNIPEYQARVVKDGRVIHQARIIVGRAETQTTIFSANMRYIVFGPEWGVPDSIKVKELLPHLRTTTSEPGLFGFGGTVTDTRILDKQNMRVVYNGKTVDASQVDWGQVDIRKFSFIQAAGPGNALGAVKFRFPNKHDIYMHDTPMRDLFNRPVRSFSHGCVRVQNPGQLAEVLLDEDKGWSATRVREMMERGGNVEVTLSKQIPVHISYFTTVVLDDGKVTSFPDIYGHDRRVGSALTGRPMPLEPTQSLDVADDQSDALPAVGKKGPQRLQKQAKDDIFSNLFGN